MYHAFGLKGIHYEATRYFGDSIVINEGCQRIRDKSNLSYPDGSGHPRLI